MRTRLTPTCIRVGAGAHGVLWGAEWRTGADRPRPEKLPVRARCAIARMHARTHGQAVRVWACAPAQAGSMHSGACTHGLTGRDAEPATLPAVVVHGRGHGRPGHVLGRCRGCPQRGAGSSGWQHPDHRAPAHAHVHQWHALGHALLATSRSPVAARRCMGVAARVTGPAGAHARSRGVGMGRHPPPCHTHNSPAATHTRCARRTRGGATHDACGQGAHACTHA